MISVDPHTIRLEHQDKRWRGTLEVYYALLGRTGAVIGSQGGSLSLQFTDEQYHAIAEKGIVLTKEISVSAAAAQIRTVVLDVATGNVGTLRMAANGS